MMSEDDTIYLDLPASLKHLNVVSAAIAAMFARVESIDDAEEVIYNIQLAVQEACSNIVRHAYEEQSDGRIHVTLTLDADRFAIRLDDTGRSFSPESVPDPNLEELQEHGLGLYLMSQLMDEVRYEAQPDRNCWFLTKYLQKASRA